MAGSSPDLAFVHGVHGGTLGTVELLGELPEIRDGPHDTIVRQAVGVAHDGVADVARRAGGAPNLLTKVEESVETFARREVNKILASSGRLSKH